MSSVVPLSAVPNQKISITLNGSRYEIRFRECNGVMALDLTINDELVLSGDRVVSGAPLIPYKYLEKSSGNFLFLTELGDYPYWDQFGITQRLIYFTAEELEEIRAA